MHQEIQQNSRIGSKGDLLLLTAIVVGIFLLRCLTDLFSTIVGGAMMQGIAFIIIVAICLLVYKKRLSTFGYAFYYEDVHSDEVDQYGEAIKYPFEVGTFIASRISGTKARSYETVHIRKTIDFLPPEDKLPESDDIRFIKMTVYPKKTAHRLVFRKENKTYCWYIHPSEELARLLNEAMNAKKAGIYG